MSQPDPLIVFKLYTDTACGPGCWDPCRVLRVEVPSNPHACLGVETAQAVPMRSFLRPGRQARPSGCGV